MSLCSHPTSSFYEKNFTEWRGQKRVVDAFDVANVLALEYQSSHSIKNHSKRISQKRDMDFHEWCPPVTTLVSEIEIHGRPKKSNLTLSDLSEKYEKIMDFACHYYCLI